MLATAAVLLHGCKLLKDEGEDAKDTAEDVADDAKDTVKDAVTSEVKGSVTNNRGEPVEGVTIRLYDLLDNTDFVEGSDVGSLEAYIDREAVLSSDNELRSGVTKADGTFSFEALPSAFLAVATMESCSAGFAGFDEETGVLNLDTLIKPTFKNGLSFSIPTFVLACAEPPEEVEPAGNTEECPPFEPEPPPPPTCDVGMCTDAGGQCEDDACVITCALETCAESGGVCFDGECVVPPLCDASACEAVGGTCEEDTCVTPSCDAEACGAARGTCNADGVSCDIPPCFATEADCEAAGGMCSDDGAGCLLPACSADADCEAGQPGSWCDQPGDVLLAKCEPPAPTEIVPPPPMEEPMEPDPMEPDPMEPMKPLGWTELRITDSEGNELADASEQDRIIPGDDIPEDGLIRIYAKYNGPAETAYVQLQSGGQMCARLPPRTDFIEVELEDGVVKSEENDYVELMLHGGCQKLMMSTEAMLGRGARSRVVKVGDQCAPPRHAFIAILTWEAGRRRRADLDLNVWNAQGELVHVGHKQRRWGWLRRHGRGPGPEVFISDDASEGPFTIKVQFFSGRPRDVRGKVRILRVANGEVRDESFTFTLNRPKEVAEIGVFEIETGN